MIPNIQMEYVGVDVINVAIYIRREWNMIQLKSNITVSDAPFFLGWGGGLSVWVRCTTTQQQLPNDPTPSPTGQYMRIYICNYNLNFSFHFGLSVWGLIDVARMNFAGTGPPIESRCSRLPPSFRLKLSRKLWCLRSLSWWGESRLLSKHMSDERVRGVSGGCGDTGVPAGWIPSMQYGSLNPVTYRKTWRLYLCYKFDWKFIFLKKNHSFIIQLKY